MARPRLRRAEGAEKLIELGYLAEGEDDGAYGSKTTAAVRRFQKANGLSVDGIAGQATQTRLFEDPNVVPYSPPTVPPTATPTPRRKRPRQRHLRRMICLCRAHPAISRWIR